MNINIKDSSGFTIIFLAVNFQMKKTVQELIRRNVDICEKSAHELTVLHRAAEEEDPEMLELLLQNGAKKIIIEPFQSKWTPLGLAAKAGHRDNMRLLIEAGANANMLYEEKNFWDLYQEGIDRRDRSVVSTIPEEKMDGDS
jgi:ankyrin repeat protein